MVCYGIWALLLTHRTEKNFNKHFLPEVLHTANGVPTQFLPQEAVSGFISQRGITSSYSKVYRV